MYPYICIYLLCIYTYVYIYMYLYIYTYICTIKFRFWVFPFHKSCTDVQIYVTLYVKTDTYIHTSIGSQLIYLHPYCMCQDPHIHTYDDRQPTESQFLIFIRQDLHPYCMCQDLHTYIHIVYVKTDTYTHTTSDSLSIHTHTSRFT